MSRIEAAMEKAARMRENGAAPGTEPVNGPESAPGSAPGAAPEPQPSPGTSYTAAVSPQYGKLSPDSPFLVNLHNPHSPTAEEYRKLKSALVKLTKGEQFKNTLMVTSALPNEGKSLTAINLALSMAQELDHTVLLIDADLRRPSVHRYLNLEQGIGLSEVLAGEAQLGECIIATGIGKLSVIRAGHPVENPVELFSSQRAKTILKEMKHRYPDRYIIFDTPPLLPFAESRSLAHLVDGVLFVVMERLASQGNIKDAIDSLKGCPVLGTIFNAATVDGNDGRYSYYRYTEKKSA